MKLTNAMGVLFDATVHGGWNVKVDDVHHVADVNAASSYTGGDENRRHAGSEGSESSLSLGLTAVTVHGSHREAHMEKEVVETVDFAAAVAEDDGANTRHLLKQLHERLLLFFRCGLDDDLLDVFGRAANATNAELDMIRRKIRLPKLLGGFREGSRE